MNLCLIEYMRLSFRNVEELTSQTMHHRFGKLIPPRSLLHGGLYV